ncbi:MAG: hypothetical protein ACREBS_11830 [Nitrososphaerales archaeon]
MPKKTSAKNVRQLRAKDISGKWKVTEMPDFEEDYLSETRNPHVNLSVKGANLSGDYEFALESGELNGEVIQDEIEGWDGVKKKRFRILFSFEGTSEMDEENGYGEATLSEDGKTLAGRMNYHGADRYRFVWKRLRAKSKA